MAYEKQTWVTGDTITAEKLNHMEDGIGVGGPFIVKILKATEGNHSGQFYLDKTPAEMIEAYNNGLFITADATVYEGDDYDFSFSGTSCGIYFDSERGKYFATGFGSYNFITDGTLTKEEAADEILWEDLD